MKKRTANIILVGMIGGAVLGVIGGYYFSGLLLEIRFIGTIFLNALMMIVIPLIVASIIVGVTSLGDIRKLGGTALKTMLYYLATTSFSVLVGIILVNIIQPGSGVEAFDAFVPEKVVESQQKTLVDVVIGLVPDNIFKAAADGRVLPLIVFSLLFGGVLTAIGDKGKPVIDFFVGLNAAIMKIVLLIICFAPVGIFALIGAIVAEKRDSLAELVAGLGLYAVTVVAGLLIHAVITIPLILRFLGRRQPFPYFLNMGQALATAATTASSSATLPTATLVSIGAAGIPEAGLVMMVIVLGAVGLPLEGIGLLWAIDWFLDRCRTTVNVWGDSVGAAVISETSEMKGIRNI